MKTDFYAIEMLGLTYPEMVDYYRTELDLSPYYAKNYFKQLYSEELPPFVLLPEPDKIQEERTSPPFGEPLQGGNPYPFQEAHEGKNIKFTLQFDEETFSESVIIQMKGYKTLCISSQTGCKWGCAFCQTGKLGFRHNLSTAQIIAQFLVAKHYFEADISNIVFMGMGEALDNFNNVVKAIDIFAHPYGLNLATGHITLSTVGSVVNIEKLSALIEMDIKRAKHPKEGEVNPTAYRNLLLAVSLNASNNTVRSKLMSVNATNSMEELKEALKKIPLKRKYHNLFIEYVLIPGFTDSEANAQELVAFLSDLPCVVNLIEYNPPLQPNSGLLQNTKAPNEEEVDRFFKLLVQNGQVVRRRHKKGSKIGAACGCLGSA